MCQRVCACAHGGEVLTGPAWAPGTEWGRDLFKTVVSGGCEVCCIVNCELVTALL